MATTKSNLKTLSESAKAAGIGSITELARRIPCARVSVYLAMEKPTRYPRVYRRIQKLTSITTTK